MSAIIRNSGCKNPSILYLFYINSADAYISLIIKDRKINSWRKTYIRCTFYQWNKRICQKCFTFFFLFLLKTGNNYENKSKVRFFNKKLKFNTCDATKQLVNIFYFMLCKDQFFITYSCIGITLYKFGMMKVIGRSMIIV